MRCALPMTMMKLGLGAVLVMATVLAACDDGSDPTAATDGTSPGSSGGTGLPGSSGNTTSGGPGQQRRLARRRR